MINVNSLIQGCFQKCSLCGDGQTATGSQANNGLSDLKDVLSDINTQNLLLDDVKFIDVIDNKIILCVKPENWFEYNNIEDVDLSKHESGDVFKINTEFYKLEFVDEEKTLLPYPQAIDFWPSKFIDVLPDRVESCSRKLGNRFIPLFPTTKQVIDSKTKQGLANIFTPKSEWKTIIVNEDRTNQVEYFIVEFDSLQTQTYRLTYLQSYGEIDLDSNLLINNKYQNLICSMLCVKLCQRYKLYDYKADFEKEVSSNVYYIKRINEANRVLTYGVESGSYQDSYFGGLSPQGW